MPTVYSLCLSYMQIMSYPFLSLHIIIIIMFFKQTGLS